METLAPSPADPAARLLAALPVGGVATVESVTEAGALSRRLLEIGFFPGARVEVLAVQWPGDDPLAVRVGGSTFALRRREAELVTVSPARPGEGAP